MTRKELIAFIIEKLALYPELKDEQFIKGLFVKYQEKLDFAKNYNDKAVNIKEQISTETLVKTAVALEFYDRYTTGKSFHINDYASRPSSEELEKFINEMLNKYPQLRIPGFLDKLLKDYYTENN